MIVADMGSMSIQVFFTFEIKDDILLILTLLVYKCNIHHLGVFGNEVTHIPWVVNSLVMLAPLILFGGAGGMLFDPLS